jgi:hypothetical protein
LSHQLSGAWHEVLARARPLADATDGDEVAWATDEASARVQLLARWMDELPCSDWFWRPVAHTAGLHSALRPRDDVARAHAIVALLTAPIGRAGGEAMRTHGEGATATDWWPDAAALFTPPPHWRLAAQVDQRLPATQQVAWLDALYASGDAPAMPAAVPPLQQAGAAPQPAHRALSAAEPVSTASRGAAAAPRRAATSDAAPGVPHPPTSDRENAPTPLSASSPRPTHTHIATLHGQPSAWAGLWLMLPLLRRSRLSGDHAEAAHTRALALALMQRAAERWGLDPLCRDWISGHRPQAHPLSQPLSAGEIDRAWHTARRHTLQHARLPLQRLLHRPGQVWLAPHRVDVQFPLRSAHIGIRRAGLDIDPGYLPWLDTVVHFHYV